MATVALSFCREVGIKALAVSSTGNSCTAYAHAIGFCPEVKLYLFMGEDVSGFERDELARLRREAFGFVFQSYNLIARTSHLPHLVAALLAGTVGRASPLDRTAALCGSGFRDTSRVAEGSPEIWSDILETNRDPIAAELRSYRAELDTFLGFLERGEFEKMEAYLERCRGLRRSLLKKNAFKEGEQS